jgi:hypothetical protein
MAARRISNNRSQLEIFTQMVTPVGSDMAGFGCIPVSLLMRDTGHRIDLELCRDETIADVKKLASDRFGKPVFALKANRQLLRDDEHVRDVGLRPGTVIFVNPQVIATSKLPPEPRQIMSAPAPIVRPVLPLRGIGWTKESVVSRVQALVAMGFPQDQCELALAAAGCNVDRAGEYLLSGSIPDMAVKIGPHQQPTISKGDNVLSFQKEEKESSAGQRNCL